MISGHLALTVAALFTGAALYINVAEQPARLLLDDRAQLAQWKPSYARGFVMQASLAVVGFVFAVASWWTSGVVGWLIGGLVLLANWPFTLFVIMPTNTTLNEMRVEAAGPQSRTLIMRWGSLHAVRTLLGALATLIFLLTLV